MFNPQELTIDRVKRVAGFDLETGMERIRTDEVESSDWEFTGEGEEKTNAIGAVVAIFDRAKGSTFSGETPFVNTSLLNEQWGSKPEIAGTGNEIAVRKFEILTVGGTAGVAATTLTLSKTPATAPGYIYLLNKDTTTNKTFEKGEAASATAFEITDDEITLPVGADIAVGDKIGVWYEYTTANAVKAVNSAQNFSEVLMVDVEVLFASKCNQNVKYHGHVVFPRAKLDANFSLSLTTDGKHPFSFRALPDICDEEQALCYYVIPE